MTTSTMETGREQWEGGYAQEKDPPQEKDDQILDIFIFPGSSCWTVEKDLNLMGAWPDDTSLLASPSPSPHVSTLLNHEISHPTTRHLSTTTYAFVRRKGLGELGVTAGRASARRHGDRQQTRGSGSERGGFVAPLVSGRFDPTLLSLLPCGESRRVGRSCGGGGL